MEDLYFSCSIVGISFDLEMLDQANCVAPTEACNSFDSERAAIDSFALFGLECTSNSTSGSEVSSILSTIVSDSTQQVDNEESNIESEVPPYSTIVSDPTQQIENENSKIESDVPPIMMNADVFQCTIDTEELQKSSQELMDAQATYNAVGEDAIENYDLDSGIIAIDVPEDVKNNYLEVCTESGLDAVEMVDSYYSCSPIGISFNLEMKNQAVCLAPTKECKSLDIDQIAINTFALFDMNCTLSESSESSESLSKDSSSLNHTISESVSESLNHTTSESVSESLSSASSSLNHDNTKYIFLLIVGTVFMLYTV